MATTKMVHVRVDDKLKEQATETLAAMGFSVSDAEQRLPFALKVPNAGTRAAMAEADGIAREHRARFGTADALFGELEKNRSE